MIRLNLHDAGVASALDDVFSLLLPHENYNSEKASSVYLRMRKVVNPSELEMEYYVFLRILSSLMEIKSDRGKSNLMLTKESFLKALEINIPEILDRRVLNLASYLRVEGMDDSISSDDSRQKAMTFLYQRAEDLYDRCFELAIPTDEYNPPLVALREIIIRHSAETSLMEQSQVLNGSLKAGRNTYSGASGWLSYTNSKLSALREKKHSMDDSRIDISTLEKVKEMLLPFMDKSTELGEYGIPNIDDVTPMKKAQMLVLCGAESVGKTTCCVALTATLLNNGHKVAYMLGENVKEILYDRIIIALMLKKFNRRIERDTIVNTLMLPEDECNVPVQIQKAIMICIEISMKNLIMFQSLTYGKVYEELYDHYISHDGFDAVIVDHAAALRGTLSSKEEQVASLGNGLREFKLDTGAFVVVASHLSGDAGDDVSKGRKVSKFPTKYSQVLSAEADDIWILSKRLDVKCEEGMNVIAIQVYKRRYGPEIYEYIYIKLENAVCALHFDKKIQPGKGQLANDDEIISDIGRTYSDDPDDYYVDGEEEEYEEEEIDIESDGSF